MAKEKLVKDKIYDYIVKFSKEVPSFPTWIEIAKHNGNLSKTRVWRVLKELNEEGKIKTLKQLRIKHTGYRLPKY